MDRIYYIPTTKKVISLTFDDGPSIRNTLKILRLLRRYHVKATFFLLTDNIIRNLSIVEQIIKDKHTIGLHGVDHRSFVNYKPHAIKNIIQQGLQCIEKNFNIKVSYIRPPYGTLTAEGYKIQKEFKLIPVGWSIMTNDWIPQFINEKFNEICQNLSPGKIIAMHDSFKTTTTRTGAFLMLRKILPYCLSKNYSFVSIKKLRRSLEKKLIQKIGAKNLFSASKKIIPWYDEKSKYYQYQRINIPIRCKLSAQIPNKILSLSMRWDMNTIRCNKSLRIKIRSNNYESKPTTVSLPSPYAMGEWNPIYELELEPNISLRNIKIYVQTRNLWIELNTL